MLNKKTLVFVPTYNEKENVIPLWEALKSLQLAWDVVFLDDNSPDGTGEILDQIAAGEPNLKIIHRRGKEGIGTAHQAGIRYAYQNGYECLITLDADFTHTPSDIPKFIEKSDQFDVVVGSRYLLRGSLQEWSIFRRILTRLAHILTIVLLGLKYDATGAFRLYRIDHIPSETFELMLSKSYSFFFESLYILDFNGFKVFEVPIFLPARSAGNSKMNLNDALRSIGFLLTTFLRTLFKRSTLRLPRVDGKQSAI